MKRFLKIVAVISLVLVSAGLGSQPARAAEQLHHDIQLVLSPGDGNVEVTDRITVTGAAVSRSPWRRGCA